MQSISVARYVAHILLLASVFLIQPLAAQQRLATNTRVALVIGNDAYEKVAVLRNARADARAMAASLERAGYRVTLRIDANERAMKEALRTFKAQLAGGGAEAVFFFSGHGVQLGGANYLLPTDIGNDSEEQVKDDAIALQKVLDDMQDQKARLSLAIIDACRNNPFTGRGRAIGGRGLTSTAPANGQMVLFSAGSGQLALDRLNERDTNPNGVFTRVFLKEMEKPGVPVHQVLRNVRDEVDLLAKSVGQQQTPAIYDQVVGEYYFRPGTRTSIATAPVTQPQTVDPMQVEMMFWESIKGSNTRADFEDYLQRYPNGTFVGIARNRIASLSPPPVAAPSVSNQVTTRTATNPQVELRTNLGTVVIELYADRAPVTVENFLQYVRDGFYQGTIFHRVIPGFMIQGGGYTQSFQEKRTRAPIRNEADNGLRNTAGTIAMARTLNPQSATAQFFINLVDNTTLDFRSATQEGYGYTVFGRVVRGIDVVNRIGSTATGNNVRPPFTDVPVASVVIEQAIIASESAVQTPVAAATSQPIRVSAPDATDTAKRLGCFACHQVDRKVVGPAFVEVGRRYGDQAGSDTTLIAKVRNGGLGSWGQVPMPPNSHVNESDLRHLVSWILAMR